MMEVDERYPNTILQGSRTEEQQAKNVAKGVSKTLDSKHLPRCAEEPEKGVDAVDAAPDPLGYPKLKNVMGIIERALGDQPLDDEVRRRLVDAIGEYSKETARWYMFGGYVLGTADQLFKNGSISTRMTWGGDWNGDRRLSDQRFDDLAHVQRAVR
jgi:hypothetical protein